MADVLLFHHAQGLTPGVVAVRRRAAPRRAHRAHARPARRTHVRLDRGGHGLRGGDRLPRRDARPRRPGRRRPARRLVYAGFSLGVLPAQMLAQTRPGARGALLFYSCVPVSALGLRPVARRGPGADPRDGRRPDLRRRRRHRRRPRARRPGRGRGAVPLPRRPALLRRQLAALLRPGRHRAPHPAGPRLPRPRRTKPGVNSILPSCRESSHVSDTADTTAKEPREDLVRRSGWRTLARV